MVGWQNNLIEIVIKLVRTFVVILVVRTVLFQGHRTVGSVPTVIATAFPQCVTADSALAMAGAAIVWMGKVSINFNFNYAP